MPLVDVIGWIATCVGALLGLPQLVRLVRTRQVAGLSLLAWRAVLVLNLVWLAHGLRIEEPPQVVTNLVAFCTTVPLLVLLAKASGRSLLALVTPSLAVAAVIIGIDLWLGSLAFGMAAIIPGLVSNAGQSLELVRAPAVAGVSPLFLTMACVNQMLWTTWAFLAMDAGTILAGTMTLTITSFNLIWYLLRRFGLRAFFVRPAVEAATVAPRQLAASTR